MSTWPGRFSRLATAVLLCAATTSPAPAASAADRPRGMIVDFSASWCGPCQRMAPIVEKLARQGVPITNVDIDERPDLKLKYNIERLPTVVLFVDGKEVSRSVGAMSEPQLLSLAARIPAATPAVPDLGPKMLPPAADRRTLADARPRKKSLLDLFPGRRDRGPVGTETAVVRANNADVEAPAIHGGPMGSSVRIRVKSAGEQKFGSGTVVHSSSGRTLIVSCFHLFRGATADDKIEVDAFFTGRPQTHVGRVLRLDEAADVSLVEVSTDGDWPSVRVAPTGRAPKERDNVVSIGCGNGQHPTRQSLLVTDVDRYDGPNNVSCTGLPVVGRSGGGLFNAKGELIGVCGAADDQPGEENDRGFYAGLFAVHDLLDEAGMASLYRGGVGAIASTLPVAAPGESLALGGASPFEPPPAKTAMAETKAETEDDLEFVVIVRSKSRPGLPSKVVIADENADPELIRLLRKHMRAE